MSEPKETIVVKLGGTQGLDFSSICQDAAGLIARGYQVVLVHGGSAEANELGTNLGYPPRFITSPSGYTSRYTDLRTLEIFCMAVNGKINTQLVSQMQTLGVNALGLSGIDGRLITAVRKEAIQSVENGRRKMIRDDYSGKIDGINAPLLNALLASGYTPVIAPLALGRNGEILNIDGDRAAAIVAAALESDTLVLLTAVPGLLRSFPDENSLVKELAKAKLDDALEYAEGRMKKKILGAKEALDGFNVDGHISVCKKVIIADGRMESPISKALQGFGTVIR